MENKNAETPQPAARVSSRECDSVRQNVANHRLSNGWEGARMLLDTGIGHLRTGHNRFVALSGDGAGVNTGGPGPIDPGRPGSERRPGSGGDAR